MTTMITEVYEAFRSVGATEEVAKKAAEALTLETLASKADINQLKVDLAVLKWMVGFNLAFTMAMLWKVFS